MINEELNFYLKNVEKKKRIGSSLLNYYQQLQKMHQGKKKKDTSIIQRNKFLVHKKKKKSNNFGLIQEIQKSHHSKEKNKIKHYEKVKQNSKEKYAKRPLFIHQKSKPDKISNFNMQEKNTSNDIILEDEAQYQQSQIYSNKICDMDKYSDSQEFENQNEENKNLDHQDQIKQKQQLQNIIKENKLSYHYEEQQFINKLNKKIDQNNQNNFQALDKIHNNQQKKQKIEAIKNKSQHQLLNQQIKQFQKQFKIKKSTDAKYKKFIENEYMDITKQDEKTKQELKNNKEQQIPNRLDEKNNESNKEIYILNKKQLQQKLMKKKQFDQENNIQQNQKKYIQRQQIKKENEQEIRKKKKSKQKQIGENKRKKQKKQQKNKRENMQIKKSENNEYENEQLKQKRQSVEKLNTDRIVENNNRDNTGDTNNIGDNTGDNGDTNNTVDNTGDNARNNANNNYTNNANNYGNNNANNYGNNNANNYGNNNANKNQNMNLNNNNTSSNASNNKWNTGNKINSNRWNNPDNTRQNLVNNSQYGDQTQQTLNQDLSKPIPTISQVENTSNNLNNSPNRKLPQGFKTKTQDKGKQTVVKTLLPKQIKQKRQSVEKLNTDRIVENNNRDNTGDTNNIGDNTGDNGDTNNTVDNTGDNARNNANNYGNNNANNYGNNNANNYGNNNANKNQNMNLNNNNTSSNASNNKWNTGNKINSNRWNNPDNTRQNLVNNSQYGDQTQQTLNQDLSKPIPTISQVENTSNNLNNSPNRKLPQGFKTKTQDKGKQTVVKTLLPKQIKQKRQSVEKLNTDRIVENNNRDNTGDTNNIGDNTGDNGDTNNTVDNTGDNARNNANNYGNNNANNYGNNNANKNQNMNLNNNNTSSNASNYKWNTGNKINSNRWNNPDNTRQNLVNNSQYGDQTQQTLNQDLSKPIPTISQVENTSNNLNNSPNRKLPQGFKTKTQDKGKQTVVKTLLPKQIKQKRQSVEKLNTDRIVENNNRDNTGDTNNIGDNTGDNGDTNNTVDNTGDNARNNANNNYTNNANNYGNNNANKNQNMNLNNNNTSSNASNNKWNTGNKINSNRWNNPDNTRQNLVNNSQYGDQTQQTLNQDLSKPIPTISQVENTSNNLNNSPNRKLPQGFKTKTQDKGKQTVVKTLLPKQIKQKRQSVEKLNTDRIVENNNRDNTGDTNNIGDNTGDNGDTNNTVDNTGDNARNNANNNYTNNANNYGNNNANNYGNNNANNYGNNNANKNQNMNLNNNNTSSNASNNKWNTGNKINSNRWNNPDNTRQNLVNNSQYGDQTQQTLNQDLSKPIPTISQVENTSNNLNNSPNRKLPQGFKTKTQDKGKQTVVKTLLPKQIKQKRQSVEKLNTDRIVENNNRDNTGDTNNIGDNTGDNGDTNNTVDNTGDNARNNANNYGNNNANNYGNNNANKNQNMNLNNNNTSSNASNYKWNTGNKINSNRWNNPDNTRQNLVNNSQYGDQTQQTLNQDLSKPIPTISQVENTSNNLNNSPNRKLPQGFKTKTQDKGKQTVVKTLLPKQIKQKRQSVEKLNTDRIVENNNRDNTGDTNNIGDNTGDNGDTNNTVDNTGDNARNNANNNYTNNANNYGNNNANKNQNMNLNNNNTSSNASNNKWNTGNKINSNRWNNPDNTRQNLVNNSQYGDQTQQTLNQDLSKPIPTISQVENTSNNLNNSPNRKLPQGFKTKTQDKGKQTVVKTLLPKQIKQKRQSVEKLNTDRIVENNNRDNTGDTNNIGDNTGDNGDTNNTVDNTGDNARNNANNNYTNNANNYGNNNANNYGNNNANNYGNNNANKNQNMNLNNNNTSSNASNYKWNTGNKINSNRWNNPDNTRQNLVNNSQYGDQTQQTLNQDLSKPIPTISQVENTSNNLNNSPNRKLPQGFKTKTQDKGKQTVVKTLLPKQIKQKRQSVEKLNTDRIVENNNRDNTGDTNNIGDNTGDNGDTNNTVDNTGDNARNNANNYGNNNANNYGNNNANNYGNNNANKNQNMNLNNNNTSSNASNNKWNTGNKINSNIWNNPDNTRQNLVNNSQYGDQTQQTLNQDLSKPIPTISQVENTSNNLNNSPNRKLPQGFKTKTQDKGKQTVVKTLLPKQIKQKRQSVEKLNTDRIVENNNRDNTGDTNNIGDNTGDNGDTNNTVDNTGDNARNNANNNANNYGNNNANNYGNNNANNYGNNNANNYGNNNANKNQNMNLNNNNTSSNASNNKWNTGNKINSNRWNNPDNTRQNLVNNSQYGDQTQQTLNQDLSKPIPTISQVENTSNNLNNSPNRKLPQGFKTKTQDKGKQTVVKTLLPKQIKQKRQSVEKLNTDRIVENNNRDNTGDTNNIGDNTGDNGDTNNTVDNTGDNARNNANNNYTNNANNYGNNNANNYGNNNANNYGNNNANKNQNMNLNNNNTSSNASNNKWNTGNKINSNIWNNPDNTRQNLVNNSQYGDQTQQTLNQDLSKPIPTISQVENTSNNLNNSPNRKLPQGFKTKTQDKGKQTVVKTLLPKQIKQKRQSVEKLNTDRIVEISNPDLIFSILPSSIVSPSSDYNSSRFVADVPSSISLFHHQSTPFNQILSSQIQSQSQIPFTQSQLQLIKTNSRIKNFLSKSKRQREQLDRKLLQQKNDPLKNSLFNSQLPDKQKSPKIINFKKSDRFLQSQKHRSKNLSDEQKSSPIKSQQFLNLSNQKKNTQSQKIINPSNIQKINLQSSTQQTLKQIDQKAIISKKQPSKQYNKVYQYQINKFLDQSEISNQTKKSTSDKLTKNSKIKDHQQNKQKQNLLNPKNIIHQLRLLQNIKQENQQNNSSILVQSNIVQTNNNSIINKSEFADQDKKQIFNFLEETKQNTNRKIYPLLQQKEQTKKLKIDIEYNTNDDKKIIDYQNKQAKNLESKNQELKVIENNQTLLKKSKTQQIIQQFVNQNKISKQEKKNKQAQSGLISNKQKQQQSNQIVQQLNYHKASTNNQNDKLISPKKIKQKQKQMEINYLAKKTQKTNKNQPKLSNIVPLLGINTTNQHNIETNNINESQSQNLQIVNNPKSAESPEIKKNFKKLSKVSEQIFRSYYNKFTQSPKPSKKINKNKQKSPKNQKLKVQQKKKLKQSQEIINKINNNLIINNIKKVDKPSANIMKVDKSPVNSKNFSDLLKLQLNFSQNSSKQKKIIQNIFKSFKNESKIIVQNSDHSKQEIQLSSFQMSEIKINDSGYSEEPSKDEINFNNLIVKDGQKKYFSKFRTKDILNQKSQKSSENKLKFKIKDIEFQKHKNLLFHNKHNQQQSSIKNSSETYRDQKKYKNKVQEYINNTIRRSLQGRKNRLDIQQIGQRLNRSVDQIKKSIKQDKTVYNIVRTKKTIIYPDKLNESLRQLMDEWVPKKKNVKLLEDISTIGQNIGIQKLQNHHDDIKKNFMKSKFDFRLKLKSHGSTQQKLNYTIQTQPQTNIYSLQNLFNIQNIETQIVNQKNKLQKYLQLQKKLQTMYRSAFNLNLKNNIQQCLLDVSTIIIKFTNKIRKFEQLQYEITLLLEQIFQKDIPFIKKLMESIKISSNIFEKVEQQKQINQNATDQFYKRIIRIVINLLSLKD